MHGKITTRLKEVERSRQQQMLGLPPHDAFEPVSSNRSLRCRETEFFGQRQSGRNGREGSMTPLQRQNLAKQARPFGVLAGPNVDSRSHPGSKRPSDMANLPRAFGHSADTRSFQLTVQWAKSLK